MKKLSDKYKNLPEEMKAALWYTVSNIGQKIAPWLVMIILTHALSTQDYGVYSIFLSWLEIFEIMITLRIYSSGYIVGLVQKDDNKNVYTATMQTLSFLLIAIWLAIYLAFKKQINSFTEMNTITSVLMIVSFLGTVSFGLWSSRKRVDNKYRSMLVATILYGVAGPIIGALTVFLKLENPILCVIAVRIIIQLLIAIPFFVSNYRGAQSLWNKTFAKETINYNLPLLPYYLSMVLLNHSDRLMIQKFSGYSDAAIYSVAYSAAMMIFTVSGALNLSLQAWLFKELKVNHKQDQTKLISIGTIIVAACCLIEIILAPEIIIILGGYKYLSALWAMPPVVISVLVMFIYQQYVNVLFYYKRTKLILVCSVFAALCNIFLNAVFIPIYGFVAAGYTTFISYIIVLILYSLIMRKVCKDNNIDHTCYFNTRIQLGVLIFSIIVSVLMMLLYEHAIVRYTVCAIIVIIMVANKNKILNVMKARNN